MPFKVIYETGGYYANNNRYENKDFGIHIFKSRIELIETHTSKFEQNKINFANNLKEAKERKRVQLETELANLNNAETK